MPTWDPRANDLFLKALELHSENERQAYWGDLGIPAIFDHVDLAIIGVAGWRTDHREAYATRHAPKGAESVRPRNRAW